MAAALTALWLYDTGRLQAVWTAIQYGAQPSTGGSTPGMGNTPPSLPRVPAQQQPQGTQYSSPQQYANPGGFVFPYGAGQ